MLKSISSKSPFWMALNIYILAFLLPVLRICAFSANISLMVVSSTEHGGLLRTHVDAV